MCVNYYWKTICGERFDGLICTLLSAALITYIVDMIKKIPQNRQRLLSTTVKLLLLAYLLFRI